jgi:uncharacterized protein (DUF2461 family)
MPEKEMLHSIRMAIAKNPKAFMKAATDNEFLKYCGGVQGEKNKMLAPEFKAAAEQCEYIYNKQFYYWTELDAKTIISDKLMKTVLDRYHSAALLNQFLDKAIG